MTTETYEGFGSESEDSPREEYDDEEEENGDLEDPNLNNMRSGKESDTGCSDPNTASL